MADNSYAVEVRIVSKNGYHTPAEALAYYKKYSRVGITWHWWNTPNLVTDGDHDNICDYIAGKASRGEGSVNYVLSNTKLSLLVNPDNVAWASQNGNPTTVSVELSPHLDARGYKMAGWLADQMRQRYGREMQFYKHSDWFGTQCPGTIDPNRIRQEELKWRSGEYDAAPKPTPAPVPVPATPEMVFTPFPGGARGYTANKDTSLYVVDKSKWSDITADKPDKPYKAGDPINVYGTVLNKTLNATWLVTKYSFDRKIAKGFSQADWNRVEPPVVVPPAPTPDPTKPSTGEPTDYDKQQDARLSAIEAFIEMIKNFFKGK